MPLPFDEFARLSVALLVGLLIGLDRERAELRKRADLFAGIRTFPLIALAGALPSLASPSWGVAPLIATLAALAALVAISYFRSSAAGDVGATTEVAVLVTFLLGALAGRGELVLAAGIGIAVALLLNAKPRLERFSQTLDAGDIDSALELGVISCIVLPLLPNRGMGPWSAWNPFEIWLVVVAVSALSFAGFVAMRWLGSARGLLLSGAIGALVSSTAVTAAMATRSRADTSAHAGAASAAIVASVIMGWRVLALCAVAGGGLVLRVLPQVLVMSGVGLAAWRWLARGPGAAASAPAPGPLSNPFRLRQALAFALFYALVLVAMPAAREYAGPAGVYAAAALSSLVDVDAVSIAFARAADRSLAVSSAAAAIALAISVNTLCKLGVAVALGEGAFRRWTSLGLAAMALAGALAALATQLALR